MLKNIPPVLSPELLKVLCEMGHGDRIVIADGNFPAETVGRGGVVVRCDGHGVPELLEAVLTLFPLDRHVEKPVTMMAITPGDPVKTPIWEKYHEILAKADERGKETVRHVPRFDFYAEAKEAYAVVATGEKALYANVMLQKGVVV